MNAVGSSFKPVMKHVAEDNRQALKASAFSSGAIVVDTIQYNF